MNKTVLLDQKSTSIKYLCSKDKRLAKLIQMIGTTTYTIKNDGYSFLIHEVIEQMLSIKTGYKIYGNLLALCDGIIIPKKISVLTDQQIKSIGTSNAKVDYIKSITASVLAGDIDLPALQTKADMEVIKELTKLRGVGIWTAKMYLIFVLDRPDVLPLEDTAFLQSYCWLYNTVDKSQASIKKKCTKWSPYSSVASRYLYRALDLGFTKEVFHLYK